MSDEGDSTYPMQCSALRKGGFAMLKGKPCKIVEISTSKPGKHGHAKAHVVGLDLLTQKKVEDVFPTSHRVQVPNVKREEYTVVGIGEEGHFALMADTGTVRRDLSISKMCDKTLEKIQQMYSDMMEGDDDSKLLLAQVMNIAGAEVIKDFKFGN